LLFSFGFSTARKFKMPRPLRDIAGQKFGKLRALRYVGKYKKSRRAVWEFKCDCGQKCERIMSNVTQGETKSCGCLVKTSGGLTTKEAYTYKSYDGMIRRCQDTAHPNYMNYGGRGVSVYFDWLGAGGFAQFFRDVGRRPQGLTIDRIDPEGNYEPGNVQWATNKEQRMNQRRNQSA
jgi:hypothetical protein